MLSNNTLPSLSVNTTRRLVKQGAMLLAAVFALVIDTTAAVAQSTYSSEQLQKHFQRTAESYNMVLEAKPIELQKKPLMNWFNNERQQDRGALYVWEQQGKPLVLASIFTYEFNSRVYCRHEMISLADGPLTAQLDSQVVWSPQKTGMEWQTIEQSVTPANTANRRLIEMRSIVKQFSCQLKIPKTQPAKLTLLPQPLHRYQSRENGIIDGAIFSFAVGTDPEVLLVIEAVEKNGKSSYRFSPLRSHYHAVELEKDGTVVWKAPSVIALESTTAGQRPYCLEPFFVLTPTKPLPTPDELN